MAYNNPSIFSFSAFGQPSFDSDKKNTTRIIQYYQGKKVMEKI